MQKRIQATYIAPISQENQHIIREAAERGHERLDSGRANFNTLVPFSFRYPLGSTTLILARSPANLPQRTCRLVAHTAVAILERGHERLDSAGGDRKRT